ncbi:MAG: hypothetical protein J2P23_13620 [Microlunatus sp.]|nr:hypothetical protein [Microlunatus sp.]
MRNERDAEFSAFVVSQRPRLFGLACLLIGDEQQAERIVERALGRLYADWNRVEHADAEAYVRRAIVDGRLDQRPGIELIDVAAEPTPWDAEAPWTALSSLPRHCRQVLALRYYWGLSVEETAADLGVSPAAAESETTAALSALRIDPVGLDQLLATVPVGTTAARHDLARARRRLRNRRLRVAGVAAAMVATVVLAWQGLPGSHQTPPGPQRPRAAGLHGTTSAGCRVPGLRASYPGAGGTATGIRSALVAHLDPKDHHVERPGTQLNCLRPDGSIRREVQSILSWVAGSDSGVIIVNVANFDDPAMTGCGTGWRCFTTPTRARQTTWAYIVRDTGDRGFGVVVRRQDGQYVSIQAGMVMRPHDIDLVAVEHFPFGARDLLAVAVDPQVSLSGGVRYCAGIGTPIDPSITGC